MPGDVFEAAFAAACNARPVRVARRRQLRDFSDAAFVAEAAARHYIIALDDARGSATRIFPSAAAPREHRPSSRAPQIEDAAKLAAMPGDVFEAAFAAACNAKVIRFEQSRHALRNPPKYTLERVFGTTDVAAINALSEDDFQDALSKGKAAAGLSEANVDRFQRSLRAIKGHRPEADLSEFTLERVFHTTDIAAINALSEEAYQGALAKVGLGKAASDAKKSEQYYAEKEANNGKMPKFKGNESCPNGFEATQKKFPAKFRPHLKECSSCRDWAYRVSQLQAAPVGAYPPALTVVKCAAKVQDEKGVKFPGRIVVESYRAAAKAAKRKGAKGAAPPAKKSKK